MGVTRQCTCLGVGVTDVPVYLFGCGCDVPVYLFGYGCDVPVYVFGYGCD